MVQDSLPARHVAVTLVPEPDQQPPLVRWPARPISPQPVTPKPYLPRQQVRRLLFTARHWHLGKQFAEDYAAAMEWKASIMDDDVVLKYAKSEDINDTSHTDGCQLAPASAH